MTVTNTKCFQSDFVFKNCNIYSQNFESPNERPHSHEDSETIFSFLQTKILDKFKRTENRRTQSGYYFFSNFYHVNKTKNERPVISELTHIQQVVPLNHI